MKIKMSGAGLARGAIIVLLVLIFLFRLLDYIGKMSGTYDEPSYISRGYATLKTGDFRLRDFNTFLVPYISSIPLFFSDVSCRAWVVQASWVHGPSIAYP